MPKEVSGLINLFQSMPGIGPKAATRIVLNLLTNNRELGALISSQIQNTLAIASTCPQCGNLSLSDELCAICADTKRIASKIAIVGNIMDIYAIEKTNAYDGLYFVFTALNSLFNDRDDFDKVFKNLSSMIENGLKKGLEQFEIIFALPFNIDSEVACSVLQEQLISNFADKITVTRISVGMPSGADFDYTDKITILKSFKERAKYIA